MHFAKIFILFIFAKLILNYKENISKYYAFCKNIYFVYFCKINIKLQRKYFYYR